MSMLHRQPWTHKFATWLQSAGFDAKSMNWVRAGGTSELLAIGHLQNIERPIVLFLHGLGNDALFPNVHLFQHLLESGYNIVTTDLDGHGKTCTSLFGRVSIKNLVTDMIDQIDQLTVGRPRLHLCGYSIGAALLLDYAVHNPERIQSLSMIGLPLNLNAGYLLAAEVISPLRPSYMQALRDYGFLGIHPSLGPILRSRYPVRVAPDESGSYLYVAARIIENINPLAKLQLVTFPSLLVAGSLDFFANHRKIDEFIASLNLQTFSLTGETHFTSMLSHKLARRIEVLLRTSP
jgi:pimeloyl-ACP methyl ester carboxylesterase